MKSSLILIGARIKVHPSEVIALEAVVNYTTVYMRSGRAVLVATPLKLLEKRFKLHTFFRTHQSYLINLEYVADYDHEHHLFVDMQNNIRAMISRRKRVGFKAELRRMELF